MAADDDGTTSAVIDGEPRVTPPETVVLPAPQLRPAVALLRRLGLALALVVFVAATVWLDRAGYTDDVDGRVGALDAFYYATVTITTTGYGDITPVSPRARLLTAVLVTPARVMFLIMLVGTTVELLTERWRTAFARSRWRSRLRDHYIVCGFGTTGQSAVRSLLGQGVDRPRIVVVDPDRRAVADASEAGFAAVSGDASRVAVLQQAGVAAACAVVVAPNRDDSAVLITLTARELSPATKIVAAVRELENAHLLRQSGADSVITSAEASGRLLGLATRIPRVVEVVEDLLRAGEGLDLIERDVVSAEVDVPLAEAQGLLVVAVIRDGRLLRFDDVQRLQRGDRLVGFPSGADRQRDG